MTQQWLSHRQFDLDSQPGSDIYWGKYWCGHIFSLTHQLLVYLMVGHFE